ncbi:MAG: sigma-70 family RNA polymerase sigma factor [Polyangiaceae bacterium]
MSLDVTPTDRTGAGTPLSHDAVRQIHQQYGFLLRRRCLTFLRNPELAEDALQEAFLKLLRLGGSFTEAKEPLRWLYRLIDHACLDQLRRGKRLRHADPIDDVMLTHPNTDPTLRKEALEVLAELDDESARIAIYAFVDGMTQDEIAHEVGLSRVSVNKRIAKIREHAVRCREEQSRAS